MLHANHLKLENMENEKIDFIEWSEKLESVWKLKTGEDCDTFSDLMYMLSGNEDLQFAEKLIDAVQIEFDEGPYEGLYNALWAFPEDKVGGLLARRLPEFQRRMGRYDQVSRFYIPIEKEGVAQQAFVNEAANWNTTDRRTAITALKKWVVESKDWEIVLEKLGVAIKKEIEDPIPGDWSEEWQKRLKKGRKTGGEYGISDLLWKGGKKNWLDDLDFLFELLALNHGKNWRQVDTMTNPLWFYAKTTVYPEFISRLASLPKDKQTKILKNIKKSNQSKYKQLVKDLENIQ